jgi:murein DD-endopeptidase MepM/ murein hydrolase activator NlpD
VPARGPDMKRMDESTDTRALPAPLPAALSEADEAPEPTVSPAVGARVIARVVDPLVREDGRGDPQLILRTEARPPGEDAGAGSASRASHPVRDRLLAKARAASSAAAHAPTEGPSEPEVASPEPSEPELGFKALPELADDLDLIGAPERRRAPEPAAPALTSPAALLLGTLFGVTLMAVLFASLIQLAPHDPLGRAAPPPLAAAAPQVEPTPAPKLGRNVRRPPRRRVESPWRIERAEPDGSSKRLSGSIGANSFLGALQGAGINLREAYRVLNAFNGVKDLNRCRPKDTFSALIDAASGHLTAFEYNVSDEEVYQARAGKDGRLLGQKLDLSVRRDRVQGVIVVDAEFEAASLEAGFEPGLGDVLNKALAGYSSVAELKRGDVLALVVQEVTVLGEFSRYAGVEALEYRPVGAEPVRIYYHETEKSRGYVDSKGRVFGKSRWSRPVPGAAVTSRFNPKRLHPILKRIKPHNGTDFGAPVGTPVVAAGFGKVSFVGEAGPNGNMITLAHSGGYQTGYSHLSRFAKGLKVGDRVEQKQLIGYVGSTGRSTGPHLHFSAKKNDRFIDPESLNLDAFSRLALSDRELLSELRHRYDRLLSSLPIPEPQAPAPEPEESAALDSPVAEPAPPPARAASAVAASDPPPHVPAATVQAALLPQVTPNPGAAARAPSLSIYLTDQELMQRQPVTDDGEVEP